MENKRKIIVVTPVRNEGWILDTFLKATSMWADHIIISDQRSTDDTCEIASRYKKVTLLHFDKEEFNEYDMRAPLIAEARKIQGEKIIFSFDADEILTYPVGNVEWEEMLNLPIGTIIQLPLRNVRPGFSKYWEPNMLNCGIVDDRREFFTGLIHVPRLFEPTATDDVYTAHDLGLLHYQYVDWCRMQSKHRWYQCYEHIVMPEKSVIELYRQYHHMYNPCLPFQEFDKQWIEDYAAQGIDISDVCYENTYWWDAKVMEYLKEYGAGYFARIPIWGGGGMGFAVNSTEYSRYA